jgi:hypothetical protein
VVTDSYARDEVDTWVVDLASGRIVRREVLLATAGRGRAHCKGGPWPRKERAMDKEREEAARRDLNPIEDIKGAVEYVENLHPVEKLKDALETAARILEPRESDVRAVRAEEDSESESDEER